MDRAHARALMRARREHFKSLGLLGRRRRLPRQQEPNAIRTSYLALVRPGFEHARELVARHLLPVLPELLRESRADMREDSDESKRALSLLRLISGQFFESNFIARLDVLTRAIAERTSDFHERQLGNQIKAGLGLDYNFLDRNVQKAIGNFTADNVSLIKSASSKYFESIERITLQGIRNGTRWEQVAGEIQARAGVAKASAELIARDQVGKFYGELARERQTELGITRFVWRTLNDSRVRDEHAERDGQAFDWNDPPDDGIPGFPVNCRCFADPDLTDLLKD